MEDAQLIKTCLQGHRGAFETLVDKYHKIVFNIVSPILSDYDDADDVTLLEGINSGNLIETKTGQLAIAPLLHSSRKDMWQLYFLKKSSHTNAPSRPEVANKI